MAAPSATGQGVDPLGKTLGLTPDQKALPVWAQPGLDARLALGKITRAMQEGVVLVGTPRRGHGTAWVISREHRLLATNAHVADIMHPAGTMQAIVNNTSNGRREATSGTTTAARTFALRTMPRPGNSGASISFALSFDQGSTYQIDLVSKEFDPYLRLEDEDGNQLTQDDDGGFDLNARMYVTAPHTGTYRIIITSYAGERPGTTR